MSEILGKWGRSLLQAINQYDPNQKANCHLVGNLATVHSTECGFLTSQQYIIELVLTR